MPLFEVLCISFLVYLIVFSCWLFFCSLFFLIILAFDSFAAMVYFLVALSSSGFSIHVRISSILNTDREIMLFSKVTSSWLVSNCPLVHMHYCLIALYNCCFNCIECLECFSSTLLRHSCLLARCHSRKIWIFSKLPYEIS